MTWSLHIPWPLLPARLTARLAIRLAAPWRASRRSRDRCVAAACAAAWRRDPLSHPDLRRMSPRALGDLPFDPRDVAED